MAHFIVEELKKAYNGQPWHGESVLSILSACPFEKAYAHPLPNAHSPAEILLHLIAWTREVHSRLTGDSHELPVMGDWPTPEEETENYWNQLLHEFSQCNEQLLRLADELKPELWEAHLPGGTTGNPERTYQELLNGLIQHHAYHGAQISLLCKD